ncbi:cytochrome c [Mariniphaga anaerophila]|uniref:Cytochrome c n=1 Tax=Mariniphaga anaerophila TaxID=1484053 RepID=A0A1M4TSV8_9BACT|nr:cytochrome c [Mariniphaga anaerophila]SHE47484.1 cytochrome c [Mariniphaga anaerophila]
MIATILTQVPIPKDIPLPLPLPEWLLVAILIFSFLLHILFINLMVGGSILTFWYELRSNKNKDYDKVAKEIASTITVNKSMAVVLGVAPLLSINVLYTLYFYSSNALTGNIWISVIPWVAVSFLLLYLHKYSWNRLAENKPLHLGILAIAIFSFLLIPFIFLTNINLMLFPEKWGEVEGFFSAMTLPNVFPRYFHFIAASMAITGFFLAYWFGRKKFNAEAQFKTLQKNDVKKQMLNLALAATGMQFILGPLLFLTLPAKGVSWSLFWVILAGATIAVIILVQLWKMINELDKVPGKRFFWVVGLFTVLVAFMGTGRHLYRDNALATHKKMMAERTAAHWEQVKKAHENLLLPQVESEAGSFSPGQNIFQTNCAVCHAATTRLVGPAMAEAAPIYKDNIDALKKWIKTPGRKRMDYPAMAGFPQFTDKELTDVANYVLENQWE